MESVCKYCNQGRPLGENWLGNISHPDVNGLFLVECENEKVKERIASGQPALSLKELAVRLAKAESTIEALKTTCNMLLTLLEGNTEIQGKLIEKIK